MDIWVDADACPVVIKEILYRAANRTATLVILVSNQFLRVPKSPFIDTVQVKSGPDVADEAIIRQMKPGDLVITSDIPLADAVVAAGGRALSPRGELYTADNVKHRLSIRDFMSTLRAGGVETGGEPALSPKDKQAFANNLDNLLVRNTKNA